MPTDHVPHQRACVGTAASRLSGTKKGLFGLDAEQNIFQNGNALNPSCPCPNILQHQITLLQLQVLENLFIFPYFPDPNVFAHSSQSIIRTSSKRTALLGLSLKRWQCSSNQQAAKTRLTGSGGLLAYRVAQSQTAVF